MSKLYPLVMALSIISMTSLAQNPTFVFVSTSCNFVQDFTNDDGGFTSPSIYSDDNNTEFNWEISQNAWIESSGLTARIGSLISPAFINTLTGQTTVGFFFNMPAGTEYRIRVLSGTIGPSVNIVATTANGPVWTPLPSTSGALCLELSDADIIPGTLRYEFSFRANATSDMLFDNFRLSIPIVTETDLPVTFLGFIAKKINNGNTKLLWEVGDEINVDHYVVERSLNGRDFSTIGKVPATGSKTYSLEDIDKIKETRYYRVKNVDIDGQSKYTPIIKINGDLYASGKIQLYPVPATNEVYIQHDKAPSMASIAIYDMDGKRILQVNVVPNSYQTYLPVNHLKAGIYIVKYVTGESDVQTAKLIKN